MGIAAPAAQEAIRGGEAEISGGFTQHESDDLAALISYAVVGGAFDGTLESVEP